MHCHTAWGRWAVELLQCTGPAAGGTGRPAQEVVAAQRAELLLCTASLRGGSGQWNSWCGVVWCGVVWCGVVWCGVVWCGVVWCGVVWFTTTPHRQ